MAKRVYNFSPGPAVLPVSVLEEAARGVLEFQSLGTSILEIGHRSKAFEGVLAEAKALLVELLAAPKGYSILFLQGGSNLQFSMVPMNLLRGTGKTADYILAHGLAEVSLRPLGEALGTSARMLIYYFGSKEQLVVNALKLIAERERAGLASGGIDPLRAYWSWAIAPERRPYLRLLYEIYGEALRDPQYYGSFLADEAIE